MIERVSIRNFKSLRDVRVGLERFTVFVGPNASGKTSVLQALRILCHLFQIQEPIDDTTFSNWVSRGSMEAIELAADLGGECFRFSSQTFYPVNSVLGPPPIGPTYETSINLDSADWKRWAKNVSPLPKSVLLRLDPSKIITPTTASPDPTVMAPDGVGIHAALASMALNDPDSWQTLQADLRRIIPTIQRLRHTKVPLNQIPTLLFDMVGADSLPASQVSEGTLLVLGLLGAFHASERPNLILLDDLDRDLHPLAQKDLVALLRGLLETNPDLQIVATTHSPYLLDCMQPNEVRMTYLQDGSTLCAPLEDHPKFEKWKREMAPGEMWSLFGEKWLAEKKEAVA